MTPGRLPALLAALLLALCMTGTPLSASDGPAAMSAQTVSLLNGVRARRGLPALRRSSRLDRAARAQADWMARTGRLGHRGPDGSTPLRRIRAAGYGACHAAENVAYGPRGGAGVLRAWLSSPGHRRNALSSRVGEVGAAMRRDARGRAVWVMVFGAPCR